MPRAQAVNLVFECCGFDEVTSCSALLHEVTGRSRLLQTANTLSGCSALPALLEAAVLRLLVEATDLFATLHKERLRNEVEGCSELVTWIAAQEAGRFMVALRNAIFKKYHRSYSMKRLELYAAEVTPQPQFHVQESRLMIGHNCPWLVS